MTEENVLDFPKKEEEILEFWKKNKIFEKSVEQRKGKKEFVFYEGPPYANGRPGIHHIEARAFKDIILRYKTMAGFYVPRRAGWDTHGLPTEIEVEKKLGIKSKKDIEEKIGIERFIEEARQNVFLYKEEWEKLTERMAYWLDMENAYATMNNNYIETLWWVFKEIDKKKLLYEDYKVIPWCPRCGTALSSHEVSQGYRKIKEDSIYIKFPVKGRPNTYFLVWTTTPWTLASNVALAINPKIDYVIIGKDNEKFILAKSRLSAIEGEYKVGDEKSGSHLVGMEYEPLYSNKAPYKIFAGDFVSAEEGTGVVHIAPAFGEDDMNLAKANNLPVLNLVDAGGKMLTPNYKWNEMFIKEADSMIVEDLKMRNLLYKVEPYEHDYPFCWRCESPLMYYAKTSWWLKTTAVKQKMINENKKINWHPGYLKTGRFGEWLNELRDWAISRERYWGTPLPIWRCRDCKTTKVIGSLDELKKETLKSGNNYYLMRHGWAENNQKNISSSDVSGEFGITANGKKEILNTVKKLKKQKIDLIFASDFLRTKETALLVAESLNIPQKNVIFDARLREVNTGIFNGRPDGEYHAYFSSLVEKFSKTPPAGENLIDLKKRATQFLYELKDKYKNRNILIVSHEYSIWMLETGAMGWTNEESAAIKEKKDDYIKTGEVRKFEFIPLPHDKNYILDLHRPYIDKILLNCSKCRGEISRIIDVADVWFDSGAMPFAQAHFPFAFKKNRKLSYPANYICEAIDQTRGWFYTLLAVATLLGEKAPYKNVLSLGFVLDAKGQKMSKSRGNVVMMPADLMNKYGADAARWYFYTINQPWDEKLFKEEDIQSVLRRFILIFWNCFTYWKTYNQNSRLRQGFGGQAKLVINKWALARLNQVIKEVTKLLDDYEIVEAARLIENFVIEDISHWYIRRIRDLMKSPNSKEAKETSATLGYILLNTAKLLAPFVPFVSETIYREMKGVKKSVHLEEWPQESSKFKVQSSKLLKDMEVARNIVSRVLEKRTKFGIRVRQPLGALKIKNEKLKFDKEILDLIKGEVNVKNIIFDKSLPEEIVLDTVISEELKEEGMLRDLIRQIQDIRKKEGRKPNEMLTFYVGTNVSGRDFIVKYAKEFKKSINAKSIIVRVVLEGGYEIKIGELVFLIKSEK